MARIGRVMVGLVLLTAAVGKAVRPVRLAEQMSAAFDLAFPLAGVLGAGLVVAELLAAWLLLRPAGARMGSALGALLSLTFLLYGLGRDLLSSEPCGCFGAFGALAPREEVLLCAALFLTSCGCYAQSCRADFACQAMGGARCLRWAGVLVLCVAGLVVAADSAAGRRQPGQMAALATDLEGRPTSVRQAVSASGRPLSMLDPRGRPTLLIFGKPSCKPCRAHLTAVAASAGPAEHSGFASMAVSQRSTSTMAGTSSITGRY